MKFVLVLIVVSIGRSELSAFTNEYDCQVCGDGCYVW